MLIAAARAAAQHAHAPYSRFHVGAAVLLHSGEVFTGCNVENASYGLTNCAERTAIFSAVTAKGKISLQAVAAFVASGTACSPCGACRQVIAEFAQPGTLIFYQGVAGVVETTIADLLPDSFKSHNLNG
jgi:cytidine deaminase